MVGNAKQGMDNLIENEGGRTRVNGSLDLMDG